MGVVELQSIEVELDRAPGVALEQVGEVVGQLGLGQIIDLVVEVGPDTADGTGVGLDGLRLQALEAKMLEMGCRTGA